MTRINKYIAHAGIASRRKAEELILDGRVSVNGDTMKELGYQVASGDIVEVNGIAIYNEEPVYYLLNNLGVTFLQSVMKKGVKP